MIYFCAQKNRRELVLQTASLNGIDYLEVLGPSPAAATQLAVTFLKDATSLVLDAGQHQHHRRQRRCRLTVGNARPRRGPDRRHRQPRPDRRLLHLHLRAGRRRRTAPTRPPASTRSWPASTSPSRPAARRPPTACRSAAARPPCRSRARHQLPGQGLRRLPAGDAGPPGGAHAGWTETHAADLGVALVEVLAYAADHLSYQQDAVGTEAYLGTARSRISLRRHARLVDYQISEGCNARTLVCVTATATTCRCPPAPCSTRACPASRRPWRPTTRWRISWRASAQPVFASMQAVDLTPSTTDRLLHLGDDDCCLPAGATQATLRDARRRRSSPAAC